MFGRVMKLNALGQTARFGWRKSFIECGGRVNIQIVHDQPNAFGVREVNVGQFFHARREVQFCTAFGDDHMAPPRQGL